MIVIMDAPEALLTDLQIVKEWALNALPLPPLRTNDDYMTIAIEVMNHAHFLLRIGISLAPTDIQADRGVTRRTAIVLGHLVRIHKLYDALRCHAAQRQRDICLILTRLLVESASKAEYLMKAGRSSFRSFVLTSYRPEKEMLEDLRRKSTLRRPLPIERRMVSSVRNNLKEDRLSLKELMANRRWELDGKNFRQILSDLGRDMEYVYGFGSGSHFVHGDWFDLKLHHLRRVNGRYEPDWEGPTPDPRGVCPVTDLCLSSLLAFIRWRRSDPDRVVVPIIQRVLEVTRSLDDAHELSLQRRSEAQGAPNERSADV
jgi:hypothetical protein